jgi:hypothetical protein
MNLICITESELAQWVSRRYLDTLTARILTNLDCVTTDIFCTSPYLKLDDARGRIIVNLNQNWRELSLKLNTACDVDAISIPIAAILEIAPAMEQYGKRLSTYHLPIAPWSVEKVWDAWLISQAVIEMHRAIAYESGRIGCFDRGFINKHQLINSVIEKSLRPKVVSGHDSILQGWSFVLERRDTWLQCLRTEGHLDNQSMLKASAKKITEDIGYKSCDFNFLLADEDRGWNLQDITPEILKQFTDYDLENLQKSNLEAVPLFCIVTYLRLYDEIHNGNKDWRVVFNLLRFTKYSVSSIGADILTVALLATLKAEEIYSLGLQDLYMS